MTDLLSLIGIAAAMLTSLSYLPQVRKAWPHGATKDLSLHMLIVLTSGLGLWVVYGALKSDWVIVVANSVGSLLSATVLAFKIRDLSVDAVGPRRGTETFSPSWEEHSPRFRGRPHPEEAMGFFTKDIKTMDDLLLHGLQDIYYAEQLITKALPTMIEQATNRDLAQGLKLHLEETAKQIERLDQVFKKLGQKPSGTDCPAIDGLIKESNATSGEIDDKSVLDAAIVANAQAVEHYEIARYGTLIAWAEELGHDDIVRFLTTNLNEEKAANTKLNTVALRKGVNRKAAS